MKKWIIYKHHLAIDDQQSILHPSAEEIYNIINGEDLDNRLENPMDIFPNLKFSKIGAPIKCKLVNKDNDIYLCANAIKKGQEYQIDVIQGKIIDHCVNDKEWFYINGDIEDLEELFLNANVLTTGRININQYIKLLQQEYHQENKLITNCVDNAIFKKIKIPLDNMPLGLKANLYEYQKKGYSWMKNILTISHGCILGDEMGLGKTLQVISLIQYMKNMNKMPVLVISPVSLLENWKRECKKFAPDLDIYVHSGSRRTGNYRDLLRHDVTIISYSNVNNDLSMLKMINWECIVLDEAQNIKNPQSVRAKRIKELHRNNSIAVTGTPFENHITDLWSLVDFVIPGLLGTLKSFNETISDDVYGGERLEPVISPIMIRRTVKEVADDLPEKIIIPQAIEMSEVEKKEYITYQKEIQDKINNGSKANLVLLQKLRMFCTHPFLCDSNFEKPYDYSYKYQRFCEILEDIVSRGEKVIVFTSYKKMFDIFKTDIPNRFGIKVDFINGDTEIEKRQEIVDWFNNLKESAVLVLNPRAAGTGLNITGANNVIHYNLEWNPALEDQASARAYRRGQEKNVFVYRLYYINTVEEVVHDRIERKREISSAAIIGNDGTINEYEDIMQAINIIPQLL